jgi:hypothetical protein
MPREIIDLWGVRAVIADLLPQCPSQRRSTHFHPADYLALDSLEQARQADDGVVLLATYGTTRLYVVCPARLVSARHEPLDQAARDRVLALDGNDSRAKAGVRYRRIPPGERVWYLKTAGETALSPWGRPLDLAPARSVEGAEILDLLAGRSGLPTAMLAAARASTA